MSATSARDENRFTDADRELIRERMARFAADYHSRHYPRRLLSEGEQYGLIVRGAEAVGLSWADLRPAERAELDTWAAGMAYPIERRTVDLPR